MVLLCMGCKILEPCSLAADTINIQGTSCMQTSNGLLSTPFLWKNSSHLSCDVSDLINLDLMRNYSRKKKSGTLPQVLQNVFKANENMDVIYVCQEVPYMQS